MKESTLSTYILGYFLSLIFTFFSFFSVINSWFFKWTNFYLIILAAFLQITAQLICFIHLGSEQPPRWHVIAFNFMLTALGVIIILSIWIMYTLDTRVMP